jgi:hypothetical protein
LAVFVKLDAMGAFGFTLACVETRRGGVKGDAGREKGIRFDGTVALVLVSIDVDLGGQRRICKRGDENSPWCRNAGRLL